eukprot:364933-Chlamydomonas_euryale.AAC.20
MQVALGIPGADKYWSGMRAGIPLQRMGTVEEAAGAVMVLVSPWSAYITGQVIEGMRALTHAHIFNAHADSCRFSLSCYFGVNVL